MNHNIVVFRSTIRAAGSYHPGWQHYAEIQFRRHRPMNYQVVALLAIAPYLIIFAAAFFLT